MPFYKVLRFKEMLAQLIENSEIIMIWKQAFSRDNKGGSNFMVSNIGVTLLIALIKSHHLLGLDILRTIPVKGAAPSFELYPPLSRSTEEHPNRFLHCDQGFESL